MDDSRITGKSEMSMMLVTELYRTLLVHGDQRWLTI